MKEPTEKRRDQKGTRKSERDNGEKEYNLDKIFKQADEIELGSHSGAMTLMLAQTYDPEKHNPVGWLMSEKMDGVRCFWNGSNMYSRNGNMFYPPKWFKEQLPNFPLDGELWTKREDFQKIVSIVKRQDENEEWKQISFQIFDAPKMKAPFHKRYLKCKQVVEKTNSPHLVLLEQTKCESLEHLDKMMDEITGKGGEGVMVKDPESVYESRRSDKLLKVKKFEQAEAIVLAHEKGTGRCAFMMGKILVREEGTGQEFRIGSGFNDAQRRKPPKLNSRITFKFMGRSNKGIPRFPIFLGERPEGM